MKTSHSKLARALYELAKEEPLRISEISRQFCIYLLKKRKIKTLPFILEKLAEIEEKETNAPEIEAETVRPLTFSQKEKIKKIFGEKTIIKEKINPAILGGIVLKTKTEILDGSIKNNLGRLKEAMCQTPIG